MGTRLIAVWRLSFAVEMIQKSSAYHYTPHVSQPLDRTVHKALNAYWHQEATACMHKHPSTSQFPATCSKSATEDNALQDSHVLDCTSTVPVFSQVTNSFPKLITRGTTQNLRPAL